jgi:hypothetical protein
MGGIDDTKGVHWCQTAVVCGLSPLLPRMERMRGQVRAIVNTPADAIEPIRKSISLLSYVNTSSYAALA